MHSIFYRTYENMVKALNIIVYKDIIIFILVLKKIGNNYNNYTCGKIIGNANLFLSHLSCHSSLQKYLWLFLIACHMWQSTSKMFDYFNYMPHLTTNGWWMLGHSVFMIIFALDVFIFWEQITNPWYYGL